MVVPLARCFVRDVRRDLHLWSFHPWGVRECFLRWCDDDTRHSTKDVCVDAGKDEKPICVWKNCEGIILAVNALFYTAFFFHPSAVLRRWVRGGETWLRIQRMQDSQTSHTWQRSKTAANSEKVMTNFCWTEIMFDMFGYFSKSFSPKYFVDRKAFAGHLTREVGALNVIVSCKVEVVGCPGPALDSWHVCFTCLFVTLPVGGWPLKLCQITINWMKMIRQAILSTGADLSIMLQSEMGSVFYILSTCICIYYMRGLFM